jgi:hypothetical protein
VRERKKIKLCIREPDETKEKIENRGIQNLPLRSEGP